MDTGQVSRAVTLFDAALTALRQAVDALPPGARKAEAARALEQAEREIHLAEAEMAQHLGYPICRCRFPPNIMLFRAARDVYECPKCHHVERAGPGAGTMRFQRPRPRE